MKNIPSATITKLNIRESLLVKFFDITNPLHAIIHSKRTPWKIGVNDFLRYPTESLGYELGLFLRNYHLTPFEKAEKHDVFHVLLGYGTDVKNEAAMQFFLLGNGKLSPFTLGTSMLAAVTLPEVWRYFFRQYKRGKKSHPLSHWDFKDLLTENAEDIRSVIFNKPIQNITLMKKIYLFEQK